jgi:hypothetical protein
LSRSSEARDRSLWKACLCASSLDPFACGREGTSQPAVGHPDFDTEVRSRVLRDEQAPGGELELVMTQVVHL